jgi:hypothetical protein
MDAKYGSHAVGTIETKSWDEKIWGMRAASACVVVPGSGTGDLHRLRGQDSYIFDGQHGDPTRYTLDFDFE